MCRYGAILVGVTGIFLLPCVLALSSYDVFEGALAIVLAKTILYRVLVASVIALIATSFQEAVLGPAKPLTERCWYSHAMFVLLALTAVTAMTTHTTL